MNQKEITEKVEQYVLHTYNRFPVAIDRGEGLYAYDTEGNKYLDFMAGIAVYALGYHYPEYDEALKAQIDKVLHTSNLYYHEPLATAAEAVVTSTGLSKVFFTNSGAEAIEGALKAARKYAWLYRAEGSDWNALTQTEEKPLISWHPLEGPLVLKDFGTGMYYIAADDYTRGRFRIFESEDLLHGHFRTTEAEVMVPFEHPAHASATPVTWKELERVMNAFGA